MAKSKRVTKLFPDVKTIIADEMTTEIVKGLATEITGHYAAAQKNGIPAQSAHVAALDALVITSAETIRAVVPEANRSEAIREFVTQIEFYVNRQPEVKP